MNPCEIVVHEVKGNGVIQIVDLLAETVCQPRKPSHPHSHCQILALIIAC